MNENIKTIYDLRNLFNSFAYSKPKPTIRHFEKAFVINIGNIDEAFPSHKDLASDLDADYFYKETKKVNILKIREALLKRFRSEQIARFGSNHVIYPSLSKIAFKQIISKELSNFKNVILTKFDGSDDKIKISDVTFNSKINELIYLEGVFPTLGARCVFSTVSDIVSDKFSSIITNVLGFNHKNIIIEFDYNKRKSTIVINYTDVETNHIIKTDEFKYVVKINKLRVEDKDNIGKQAHRAVHEAGHAVCSIVLRKVLPEVVYSTVLDSTGAFNLFNEKDFYYDRINTYIYNVAVGVGGYVAEKMIFGEENISNGSASDFKKATESLTHLFKECGFGHKLGNYVSEQMPSSMFSDRNYSIVDENEFDKLVIEKINLGVEIATKTLLEQKTLLLKIVEYLIKNPKITNKKLKDLTKKYSVNFDVKELDANKTNFYLEMVNKEILKINV